MREAWKSIWMALMCQRGNLEAGMRFTEIAMEGFSHQVQGDWTAFRVLYKLNRKLSGVLRAAVSLGIWRWIHRG
jgi:hypothetical protein